MHVTLDGLGHRFTAGPWLFKNLSVEMVPGHSYAVTGPSGSGKSTLLGILAGWVAATEGQALLDDVSRVNWVFQNPHGTPRRTALDHVVFPLIARGVDVGEARDEAMALLEQFQLGSRADQPFANLSGGESQRLMLARAVASHPDLLLVDEPTAQLDPITAAGVNGVLSRLTTAGTIVVIATHDPATRDACTDQIALVATSAAAK